MCVFEHIYFSRPDSRLEGKVLQQSRGRMGEILARRGAGRGRPRDLGARTPATRRPTASPAPRGIPQDDGLIKNRYVARTFIQPGPGAAQARPADEVQPAAGDRRRQAGRRRRRLDRARQHHPPDRRHAARRRRQGGPPADLGAADPPPLPLRHRHVDARGDDRPRARRSRRSPTSSAPTRSPTSRWRASTRRSASPPSDALRRLLHRRLPARAIPRTANGKFALEDIAVVPVSREPRSWSSEAFRHRRASPPAAAPTCRRSSTSCTAEDGIEVVGVASDKPEAQALERARRPASRPRSSRAPNTTDREARDAAMADWLEGRERRPGRARRLHAAALARLRRALPRAGIVNVHPALLPSFPGLDAIEQALDHGVKITGVTRPLRRRGRRLGTDHPPARGARFPTSRDRAETRGADPRGRARAAPGDDPPDRRGSR